MSKFKLKFGSGSGAEALFEEETEASFVKRLWEEFPDKGLPPNISANQRPVIELPDGFQLSGLQAEKWAVNPAFRQQLWTARGGDGNEDAVGFQALARKFYHAQRTAMRLQAGTAAFVEQTNLMRDLMASIERNGGSIHSVHKDDPIRHRLLVLDAAQRVMPGVDNVY